MDKENNVFEPNGCPIGITNSKSIENLGDHVDMAIERLTEKVGELKEDITSLSKSMDKKFDAMDEKFDSIDEKLENVDKKFDAMEDKFYEKLSDLKKKIPATVEAEIDKKKASAASAAVKWMLCGVIGTILVSVLTAWAKSKMGL